MNWQKGLFRVTIVLTFIFPMIMIQVVDPQFTDWPEFFGFFAVFGVVPWIVYGVGLFIARGFKPKAANSN